MYNTTVISFNLKRSLKLLCNAEFRKTNIYSKLLHMGCEITTTTTTKNIVKCQYKILLLNLVSLVFKIILEKKKTWIGLVCFDIEVRFVCFCSPVSHSDVLMVCSLMSIVISPLTIKCIHHQVICTEKL